MILIAADILVFAVSFLLAASFLLRWAIEEDASKPSMFTALIMWCICMFVGNNDKLGAEIFIKLSWIFLGAAAILSATGAVHVFDMLMEFV